MNSVVQRVPMEAVADVLAGMRKKGVDIWSENGNLRFRAPKNALTRPEIECLRAAKSQIIALLEYAKSSESTEPGSVFRRADELMPLSFQQQAHWNSYRLQQKRSLCQAVSALHLHGALDIDAVQKAILTLVQRHEPLRTRIVVAEGRPHQQILCCDNDYIVPVEVIQVGSDETVTSAIQEIIKREVTRGIDVSCDPLFWIRLYRRSSDEHILIISLEHLISDAASLAILLRELFDVYRQVSQGDPIRLPVLPMQLADYASWQVRTQPARFTEHGSYWNEQLMASHRLRFPDDRDRIQHRKAGWGWVPLTLTSQLKLSLQKLCRSRGLTLPIAVFSAYALMAMRWCQVAQTVLRYQSDGRIAGSLQNTLGYLSAPLYVHVEIVESDTFVELVDRTSRSYCDAYEHADFSFLETRVPRPEFTRNAGFNWIPMSPYLDPAQLPATGELAITRIPYEHPMLEALDRDTEPFMELADGFHEVTGAIYFPLERFRLSTVESFAARFLALLQEALAQPHRGLADLTDWPSRH